MSYLCDKMNRPLLYQYFEHTAGVMLAHYKRSAQQNASDNLGKNREQFCSLFLNSVLPPKLRIKSGEIWDSKGKKTGQLDTIIIRDDAPSLEFGSENSYLAEGVFGVIEVKSNLNREKLREAGRSMEKVRDLTIINPHWTIKMGPYLGRPLRIVFAYEGATWATIESELMDRGWLDLFDLVCILDRGVLIPGGRLVSWPGSGVYSICDGEAACLGHFYLYLVTYGTSFIGRSINVVDYFTPLHMWNKDLPS